MVACSVLDHFIVSENISADVALYECLHEGDNPSDHCPVMMHVNVNVEHIPTDHSPILRSGLPWRNVSPRVLGDYGAALHVALTSIVVPNAALQCDDWSCELHTHDIQAYYDNIVKACLDAAEGTVGRKRKRRGNTSLRRPGWKDHVEPHRERAIFWHALWKSSGSPHDGHVADIRRRTRARYCYAVRYVKRHEEQCRANKLAEALAKDRGRDIWNEVQKISGRKTNRVAMVDGMVDDRDIGELFARKNIRGVQCYCIRCR
ncbi:hypothetical protein CAPTEDRAFT_216907 [Capitella teleta]|uniref:Endonuclease/exonuclease/phosphatase domain-containing protein n=1 Tax=Capitella teleta TaxID=283909 RepID=R7VJ68_CAPTE|nr:hypothetical protein CAPTEDRAFT_216907 [Capitella teleta]|eukprot:ELU18612.1 hypothetical protein CAPTEDRAFT_216907 [Capitella teleta]